MYWKYLLSVLQKNFLREKNESVGSYLMQEQLVQSNAKKVREDKEALASRLSRHPNMPFKLFIS